MKKSLVAVLVAISLGAGTSAFTDESTTASPKPKAAVNQEYKAALDKWKADSQAAQSAFKAAMADYLAKVKANAVKQEYEKQDDILGRVLLNNEIIHTISWFEGFYTGKTGRVSDWGANQYRKFSDLITKMILNETTAKDNSKTKENYPSPFSEN
mgnify:CR=1 FL=1